MRVSTVTTITESARREGRYEIAVDGKRVAVVGVDAIDRLRLRVGASCDDVLLAELARESRAVATYDRAVGMLASRARAAKELERALVRKGEPVDLARAAVERLVSVGYLDDAVYARQFVRARVASAGLSRRRLQAELARRGVAREIADQAIADVLADERVDDVGVLERLAERKLRLLARQPPDVQRRRLYAFLARRGYGSEEVRGVVERMVGEPRGASREP